MSEEVSFAAYLRQRRKVFGYTQDELAEMAGISKATIRKIEAGERRPSQQVAELLMDSLEVPAPERPALLRLARADMSAVAQGLPLVPIAVAAPSDVATAPIPAASRAALPTLSTPGGTGGAIEQAPTNLPVQLTPLIGRDEEIEALRKRLLEDDVRLVTLLGPPGIGKTRLAIEVASRLRGSFRDGIFFVTLAPISDPLLVIPTIAQTLGLREAAGQPIGTVLTNFLRDKQALLLLDNFEQVIAAAPAVVELLTACHGLKVAVTSREALHVRGERQFPVPPLDMPDPHNGNTPASLRKYPAVELFVERAQAVKPQFELTDENAASVAAICARLDGMPLALELAAARIKLFPAHEIASRLDRSLPLLTGGARDLPARQQTLRGAIQWSYDLLSESDKELFCKLGVFVGGCDLPAIEAVCGIDTLELLDAVESLLDKNLIQQMRRSDGGSDEPRFTMLEMIRQYAVERLAESGQQEHVRSAHASYYLDLAEQADPELRGAGQAAWLDRLEAEHDNLRAALGWFLERGNAECGLKMAGALWRFWYVRSHFTEGRRWLTQFLDLPGAQARTADRARALNGAGNLAYSQADYPAAWQLHEESMSISRELGERQSVAGSLNNMGIVARRRGEYAEARKMFEEAIATNRAIGNPHWQAINLNNLANVLHDQGDYPGARMYQEESLALFTALGDEWGMAMSSNDLGKIVFDQGDYPSAQILYERSLDLQRKMGNRRGAAGALVSLGLVAHHQSDYRQARELYEQSLGVFRDLGDRQGIAEALHSIGKVLVRQGDYEVALSVFQESFAIRKELNDKREISESHNNLGIVYLAQGQFDQALEHFEESATLRRELGNHALLPTSINNLALVATSLGDHDTALRYLDEAYTMFTELGRKLGTAIVQLNRGLAYVGKGDYDAAGEAYREGLDLFVELGDRLHIATSITRMSALLVKAGQAERAVTLAGAAEAELSAIKSPLPIVETRHYEPAMQEARAKLGAAAFKRAWDKGQAMTLDEAIALARQSV